MLLYWLLLQLKSERSKHHWLLLSQLDYEQLKRLRLVKQPLLHSLGLQLKLRRQLLKLRLKQKLPKLKLEQLIMQQRQLQRLHLMQQHSIELILLLLKQP